MSAHEQDRLSAYLDGELSADERAAVEGHLRACSACARHLEELRTVDAAARELPVEAPPGYFEAFPERLRARFPARRARRAPAWIWAAAAGLVLAVLAPLTVRRTASPVPEAARTDERDRFAPAPPALVVASPEKLPEAGASRAKAAPPAERRVAVPPASAPPAGAAAAPGFAAREQLTKAEPPLQMQKRAGPSWSQKQSPAQGQSVPVEAPPAPAGKADRAAAAEEKQAQPDLKDQDLKTKRDEAPPRGLAESVTVVGQEGAEEQTRYRALLARRPVSVGQMRQLHDAWRAFAEAYPTSPRADEARVRAIEALALAWQRGRDPSDRERAIRAAHAYLAAPESPQHERVRALLDALTSPKP